MREIRRIDLTKTRLFGRGKKEGIEEGLKRRLKEGIEKGLKEGIQIDMEDKFGEEGKQLMEMIKDKRDIQMLKQIRRAINKT